MPLGWALGGVAVTVAAFAALHWGERASAPPPPTAASATVLLKPGPAGDALGSSREQFAQLYLGYLLNTYYVESRGFCKPLLRRVCLALHDADLLADARECDTVPNDELVLAIGRYQHRVGLPVDGKAGPETVRMMLGGDFSNRRGMEEAYCQPLTSASASAATAAPDGAAPGR